MYFTRLGSYGVSVVLGRDPHQQSGLEQEKSVSDLISTTPDGSVILLSTHSELRVNIDQLRPEDATLASQFLSLKLRDIRIFHLVAETLDWRSLDPALAASFIAMITSPRLKCLSLSGFNHFPLSALVALKKSTYLRKLSFRYLKTYQDCPNVPGSVDQTTGRSMVSRTMKYDVNAGCATAAATSFNINRVQSLSVVWESQEDVNTTKELLRMARGINHLDCTIQSGSGLIFEGLSDMILLGSFATLLSLKLTIFELPTDDHLPFGGICEELAKLSGTNRLKFITLNLNVWGGHNDPTTLTSGCNLLDRLFGPGNMFTQLQKLTLFVTFNYPGMTEVYGECYDSEGSEGSEGSESWSPPSPEFRTEEVREECFPTISRTRRIELDFKIDFVDP